MRLDALLKRYPDCKLVYIIRDPVEVIPSGMSLLAGVLENGYDVWNRTRVKRTSGGGSRTSTRPRARCSAPFTKRTLPGSFRTETSA